MITTLYVIRGYDASKVRRRYIQRLSDDGYYFCEVGDDPSFDIRQGCVSPDEVPESIRMAATATIGNVEWPLQDNS